MRERVVVTGMGVVTPIGIGAERFWESLVSGVSGIREIVLFDASTFPTRIAAEVKTDELSQAIKENENLKMMPRDVQFADLSVDQALKDADIERAALDPSRVGIYLGTIGRGFFDPEKVCRLVLSSKNEQRAKDVGPYVDLYSQFYKKEENRRDHLCDIPGYISNYIASKYGLHGPVITIDTACSAGTQAIGDAYRMVSRGQADVMIAGGTDATSNPIGLLLFCTLGILSRNNEEPQKGSRPFDRLRDGFVIGEGAGIVILEGLNHALKRNAKIYGEIIGYGLSDDAYRITAEPPDGHGGISCMRKALKDADIEPSDVDYINAHGTSTPMNDRVETYAIKEVFGEHAYKIPVSSTKSMIGHLGGAAGAVEIIPCLLSIRESMVHPTINYENPDPVCDLDYVPNKTRETNVRIALSNSFGFGGQNATLVVKKFEG